MEKLSKGYEINMKDKDNVPIIIAVLLALLLVFSFSWGFGHMGGMMFFGSIFMVLILVLTVWLIVSLTQGSRK